MKLTIKQKVAVGFRLALLILILISVISYRNMTLFVNATDLRKQAYEVLANFESFLSDFENIQAEQRGYIITGQDKYLKSYYSLLKTTDQKLKSLRRLTTYSKSQQQGSTLSIVLLHKNWTS